MIAQIKFKEGNIIIDRAVADELDVKYQEVTDSVGIRKSYDNLSVMHSDDYYVDEVDHREGKYYLKDTDKTISSYDVYKRPTQDLDWVKVDEMQLVNLLEFAPKCKYPYYIEQAIASEQTPINNMSYILQQIEKKAETVHKVIKAVEEMTTFNHKVNVHVGGGLITTYNELALKEDTCTDDLQTCLNNGWRIIAVCVQNDQRRPDYILGRFNPTLNVTGKDEATR